MTIVEWNENVNQKVRRSGTSWNEPTSFIEDETRSGKMKRRLSKSYSKREFSVKMRFSLTEYRYFRGWFENTLKRGVYAFHFPKIDSDNPSEISVYRFTSEGVPSYENSAGKIIDVSMKWEEVE